MNRFRFNPYTLELRHQFTLAGSSRSTTPVMLVEIECDEVIGYGEASMPPYLGESHATAIAFLSRIDFTQYPDLSLLEDILKDIDGLAPGNYAAKAAVDIALHDWVGKKIGRAWHQIWGLNPERTLPTSFTIGMEQDSEILRRKVKEAEQFRILKVKLGGENDREIIQSIRTMTDKPIRVDVNQGWKNKNDALRMTEWLAPKGVELVEQPLAKDSIDDHAWLTERSPIPIIADESVRRLPDIMKARGAYHGINIKLMKCTGMREAHTMVLLAKALGMKVMVGCMTETSCGISAAAQLVPLADYADLDGALLIRNDPFTGATIDHGLVTIPRGPGIGAATV